MNRGQKSAPSRALLGNGASTSAPRDIPPTGQTVGGFWAWPYSDMDTNVTRAVYGLREVRAVFVTDAGGRHPSAPRDAGGRELDIVNLAPRRFERLELSGELVSWGVADALKTGRWKWIMFEAQRPKRPLLWRKAYRKTIAER